MPPKLTKKAATRNKQSYQPSILESLQAAQARAVEDKQLQLEIIDNNTTVLCSQLQSTSVEQFKKFLKTIEDLGNPQIQRADQDEEEEEDRNLECTVAGDRFVKFLNNYKYYGIVKGSLGNCATILLQWQKYRNVELTIEIYTYMRTVLYEQPYSRVERRTSGDQESIYCLVLNGSAWDPLQFQFQICGQKQQLQHADVFEFIAYVVDQIYEAVQGQIVITQMLGEFLLFKYLVELLALDTENCMQVAQKHMEDHQASAKKLLRKSILWRVIQLTVGTQGGLQRLIKQLLRIITLLEYKTQWTIDEQIIGKSDEKCFSVTNSESMAQDCKKLFKLIIKFLSFCENEGLFYKHNCHINFRVQIDEAFLQETQKGGTLSNNIQKKEKFLCCLEAQDRLRYWSLLLCQQASEKQLGLQLSNSFNDGLYYYKNPTELKKFWKIDSNEILDFVASEQGFKFCRQQVFRSVGKKKDVDIFAYNLVRLAQDVVYQDYEDKQKSIEGWINNLNIILHKLEAFQPKIKQQYIERLQSCVEEFQEISKIQSSEQ
eukprot:TRINITY_DN6706_c0_g4_i1.p1 TRINITY_DN6706_c0_g4~~TRINITY_DN6706_c0_g4_i1.p1  ORF type:complete len:553 (-),score=31.64 TRINITY_DN6706_c0_g4_i1:325-1956(-)